MTQNASARLVTQLTDEEQPPLAPTVAAQASPISFAEQLRQLEAHDSAAAPLENKRPLRWALIATIIWLALMTGGLIALARSGTIAHIDASTLPAYAAGIFAPVTAFWLMALAMLRGGVLSSEHDRTARAIGALVTPIDAARDRAVVLANALEAQIMRMSAAADAAEAKSASLDAAAQREADKLTAAGEALDAFQTHVEKATERLQDAMAQAQGLIGRLEAVLPETARRLTGAVSDAAVQAEAITAASVKLVDASVAARQAADGVVPSFHSALTKMDEAGDRIAERLSLLEIQAAAASRAMDSSAEKASEALEASRTWVEQHITTIDTSVSRVEADVVRRLETLTLTLGDSSAQMGRDMPAMIEKMEQQLRAIENSMKAQMEEISTSFSTAVDSWENASMASSVQLVDAMSRARAMSAEATNAARDATSAIIASVDSALGKTTQQAESIVSASLQNLQAQAAQMADLAQRAETRHDAIRASLEEKIHQDFARTADQIIDRLHAYAVDITKIYAGDVTEQELRGYLKGDRSLFVRRFAKNVTGLASNQESRRTISQIASRLAEEPEFADLTRRYLSAFEALLKLGAHRGEQDALTVSLLTSDLGKMYVALARAAGRMN